MLVYFVVELLKLLMPIKQKMIMHKPSCNVSKTESDQEEIVVNLLLTMHLSIEDGELLVIYGIPGPLYDKLKQNQH